jgi:hypothetical protein
MIYPQPNTDLLTIEQGIDTLSVYNAKFNRLVHLFADRVVHELSVYWTDGINYYESRLRQPCTIKELFDQEDDSPVEIISLLMHVDGGIIIDTNTKDEIFLDSLWPLGNQLIIDKIRNLEWSVPTDGAGTCCQVLRRDLFATTILDD